MNNIVVGMLAHVDAGKTSMAEALLFTTGTISKQGRVDHKDAYLDTNYIEKDRGITIFSKQAVFDVGNLHVNLLDTPGHIDFSSEMERTLAVLDCAILVVSGPDGVQSHTKTLINLLKKYNIPCFVWVNKMDIAGRSREEILLELNQKMESPVLDIEEISGSFEKAAETDEAAMEEFFEKAALSDETLSRLIFERKIFPCYFGSALKLDGIEEFLKSFEKLVNAHSMQKKADAAFGATVYKITRDEKGVRLTHIKVNSGSIGVRDVIADEKISQIRIYNGNKFETVQAAEEGNVYALVGLEKSFAGEGLGISKDAKKPLLMPVLNYGIKILDGTDPFVCFTKFKELSEEDPNLRIVWNEKNKEIEMQLMGEIQIEVLKQIILDRFGIEVEISTGKIVYRETIEEAVEGMGHFEPLKHYAEVHLLMEPLPFGSGVVFESACSLDVLDLNWQRLILTNLAEKKHLGVLTGNPITDMRITLVAGRAHLKHTEGGDFRQATYRAVRQGLMKAKNVLLEPYYDFTIEVPESAIGRAISDAKAMACVFDAPISFGEGENAAMSITGRGPASELSHYQNTLLSYTKGEGKITLSFCGYYPCHNTEKVIEEIGYEPERDLENSADSVFCSHGAGVNVPWDKAQEFMHVDSGISFAGDAPEITAPKIKSGNIDFDEKELEEIMLKEFGPIKRPKYSKATYDSYEQKQKMNSGKKDYFIIDGYNLIFAWDELKELSGLSLEIAAEALIDILKDYSSFRACELSVVFDAYKVKGGVGSKQNEAGVNIVYTKEGESADFFIEKLAREIGKNFNVNIVSSDGMIQLAALRAGIMRMSSREFIALVMQSKLDIEHILAEQRAKGFTFKDLVK